MDNAVQVVDGNTNGKRTQALLAQQGLVISDEALREKPIIVIHNYQSQTVSQNQQAVPEGINALTPVAVRIADNRSLFQEALDAGKSYKQFCVEQEIGIILAAMERSEDNQRAAARLLKIKQQTLSRIMQRHGLTKRYRRPEWDIDENEPHEQNVLGGE